MQKFQPSGLDLRDVVGSEVKMGKFINSHQLDPDLTTVPKLGPTTAKELGFKKAGQIRTTTQLVGKFCELGLDYAKCVEWIQSVVTFNHSRQIVMVLLFKIEMMGLVVPPLPEDWRDI